MQQDDKFQHKLSYKIVKIPFKLNTFNIKIINIISLFIFMLVIQLTLMNVLTIINNDGLYYLMIMVMLDIDCIRYSVIVLFYVCIRSMCLCMLGTSLMLGLRL